MKTASHLSYSEHQMKAEYVDASKSSLDYLRCPIDFGCMDAPWAIATGAHHSYKTHALPSCVLRGDK